MPHSPLRDNSRFQRFGRFRGGQQGQPLGQQNPFQFQQQQLPPVFGQFDPRQQLQAPNQQIPGEPRTLRPGVGDFNIEQILQGLTGGQGQNFAQPTVLPGQPGPGTTPQIISDPGAPQQITTIPGGDFLGGPQIQPPQPGGFSPAVQPIGTAIPNKLDSSITPPIVGPGGLPVPNVGTPNVGAPNPFKDGPQIGPPREELPPGFGGGQGGPQDLASLLQLIQSQGGGFDPSNAFAGLVQPLERFEQPRQFSPQDLLGSINQPTVAQRGPVNPVQTFRPGFGEFNQSIGGRQGGNALRNQRRIF